MSLALQLRFHCRMLCLSQPGIQSDGEFAAGIYVFDRTVFGEELTAIVDTYGDNEPVPYQVLTYVVRTLKIRDPRDLTNAALDEEFDP